MKVRAQVVFEGFVQGVFFRANTKKFADALHLTGWVKNRPDGSVEAVFEGDKDDIEEAIEWCETRQRLAQVVGKTVEFSEIRNEFTDFQIRR